MLKLSVVVSDNSGVTEADVFSDDVPQEESVPDGSPPPPPSFCSVISKGVCVFFIQPLLL